MSGELIWVLGDPDRHGNRSYIQVRDLPDLCGNGHANVWFQASWCPTCSRETNVFRCSAPGCHWVTAVPAHHEYGECRPELATDTDRIRTQRLTRPHDGV